MSKHDVQRQFGRRVKAFRKRRGLSQEELAAKIGMSVDTISNIERGFSATRPATAEKIARVLNIELSELYEGDLVDSSRARSQETRRLLRAVVSLLEREPAPVIEAVIKHAQVLLEFKSK